MTIWLWFFAGCLALGAYFVLALNDASVLALGPLLVVVIASLFALLSGRGIHP